MGWFVVAGDQVDMPHFSTGARLGLAIPMHPRRGFHFHSPDNASATVAFGEAVTAITRPGKPPAAVPVFRAECVTERFCHAVDALDGVLDLTSPGAARLLVVVSDGRFVAPGEIDGARQRVAHLNGAGCAVLWLDLFGGRSIVPAGATRLGLTIPAEAAEEIGKAAVKALTSTR